MRRLVIFLLAIAIFATAGRAEDILQQHIEMVGTEDLYDAVPKESKKLMDGISVTDTGDFWGKAINIICSALIDYESDLEKAWKMGAKILLAVIICSVSVLLTDDRTKKICVLAGVFTICLLSAGDLENVISLGTDTVEELSVFSKMLIPALTAASTASGTPTTAAAVCAGSIFFLQLLVSAVRKLLIPFVYCFLALHVVGHAMQQSGVIQLGRTFGTVIKKGLRVLLFVFSGYLGLTRVISGSADALAVKALKMTVSSAVPVVGGMVADASESVLLSAKMLRDSAGIFGMLGVLAVVIVPFLKLGVYYLVLQLSSFLSEMIGLKEHTGMISAVSQTVGYLLAMVGCSGLMVLISCICFMKIIVV